MQYQDLNVKKTKKTIRVGRGISAGRGKTAGRGTKGQGSRKSGGVRPGFEGGQNPFYARIPKLGGFTSIRPKAEVVYTSDLNSLDIADNFTLFEAGMVSSPYVRVKVVLNGEITKKVVVTVQGVSANATLAIVKAGGTVTIIEQVKRQKKIQE
jgi:large subunit ribosomal protein L15